MLENLLHGLTALGNGPAIAYLIGGALIGMFLGVIPGLGGAVILSIVLAFITHINITGTLCLFLATQAGSYFSASITSILLNTPAHPEAFAVTFDGFPMSQRGEAGRALGISACSTCIGGLIGCAVLVGFLQIIHFLPVVFHPPEYIALIFIALFLTGTLGTDAVSKALISGALGLMIACVGADPLNGQDRFVFGAIGLTGGISLVGLFLGLFAIPQMILIFGIASTIARQDLMGRTVHAAKGVGLTKGFGKQVVPGILEALRYWKTLIGAALIGVVTGVVPGIGGFAANFLSYGVVKQTSKRSQLFGTGIPEGIIAPEGSSLSKEAGGMVPVLGLGIPGGVGNALFLAALTIKGIRTGYGFTTDYPTLAYEVVWVIALGGIIGTLAGVMSASQLAKVTRIPGPALVPFIMAISIVGTFVAETSFFAVMEIAVFAVLGFALRRLRYSLAAFGIGFILGPTLESNIYFTHGIYPGFTFLKSPFADILFFIALLILALKAVELRREALARRAEERDATGSGRQREPRPYPVLSLILSVFIVVLSAWYVPYAVTHYYYDDYILPVIAGSLAGIAALWRFPFEVKNYLLYRRTKPDILAPGVESLTEPPQDIDQGQQRVAPLGTQIVDGTWGRRGQYTREVAGFLWFYLLVALSFVFGFTIGAPAFCVAYGLTSTHSFLATWRKRILFAVISAATIWGITYEMLHLVHLSLNPRIHL